MAPQTINMKAVTPIEQPVAMGAKLEGGRSPPLSREFQILRRLIQLAVYRDLAGLTTIFLQPE